MHHLLFMNLRLISIVFPLILAYNFLDYLSIAILILILFFLLDVHNFFSRISFLNPIVRQSLHNIRQINECILTELDAQQRLYLRFLRLLNCSRFQNGQRLICQCQQHLRRLILDQIIDFPKEDLIDCNILFSLRAVHALIDELLLEDVSRFKSLSALLLCL